MPDQDRDEASDASAKTGSPALTWLGVVETRGDEGRCWAEAYRSYGPLTSGMQRALTLLRGRRTDEGLALLEQTRGEIEATAGMDPSIRAVLDRWYHGALAYYFYCVQALDEADETMVRAHESVVAAVGCRRVLIPLALDCNEFRFHRARIARNRLRWREMRAHMDEACGMLEGRVPLCVLGDGSAVHVSDVRDRYAAACAGTGGEEHSALFDDGARRRAIDRAVRDLYRAPGQVIEYR